MRPYTTRSTINLFLASVSLLIAQGARADSISACGLTNLEFNLQPPAPNVSPEFGAYVGVWVGGWDHFRLSGGGMKTSSGYCSGMIIESMDASGKASVIYFYGRNGEFHIMEPNFIRWTGQITNKGLNLPGRFEIGGKIRVKLKDNNHMDGEIGITEGHFTRQR